jgi:putative salt-induced outer membrane protein YdiY
MVPVSRSRLLTKALEGLWARSRMTHPRGRHTQFRHGEGGRPINFRLILFVCSFLFSLPLFARENTDVIVMKNGDRITCEIKALSAGVLSVKLSYVQGTIGVQWSQVDRLQSDQLFLVRTEEGRVYTGKLSAATTAADRAVTIEVASEPETEVEISQAQVVKLDQTAEGFWQRFNGAVNTGILYAKGNESTQYNVSSLVEYRRERWSTQASFNSSLASSSNASVSTRNQVGVSGMRLLPWNNWFILGSGDFLQSSVQGIDLQTTLGGGVGRYLRNSNQSSLYVLGGLAWQNAQYKPYAALQTAQNEASALVESELKVFRFKKTDLDISAVILPGISQPGRVRVNTNASYYIKLFSDLSWNFSFYGNWDNQPPPTLSGSDYGTSSGLSWTFGNR